MNGRIKYLLLRIIVMKFISLNVIDKKICYFVNSLKKSIGIIVRLYIILYIDDENDDVIKDNEGII